MRWLAAVMLGACTTVSPGVPPRAPSPEPPPAAAPPAPAPLLAAGGVVTCARIEGRTSCWGSWADDVPPEADFDAAAPRAMGDDVEALALGWTHGCALHAGGAVRCFGRVGRTTGEVAALRGARAIASGDGFTCAVDAEGRLACFVRRVALGLRGYGPTPADEPFRVEGYGGLRHVAAPSSGWQLCVAGRDVVCWFDIDRRPQRIAVAADLEELALAPDLACARYASGEVWCWRRERLTWLAPAPVEGVRADGIAALHDRVCARSGRSWSCWRPGEAPRAWTAMEGAARVAGGMGFVCGLFDGGAIRCAGDDAYGQLGPFGPPEPAPPPPLRRTLATDAVAIAVGAAHACAARRDGSAICAGANGAGQLGDGTTTSRAAPVGVRGLRRAVSLSAGDTHTCARDAAGGVWCWGAMVLDHGEDVDPVYYSPGRSPRRIARGATELVSGEDHACARTAADEMRCWGSQWALPVSTRRPFARVPLPAGTRAIAAGGEATCAIGAAGELACFGRASGVDWPSEVLLPLPDRRGVVAVAPGSSGCAVHDDGTVRCWGRNVRGEVGDGTRTPRAEPVRVLDVSDAIAVDLGDEHACALLRSGTVRCWGANDDGQLGDGTRRDRWRPVEVAGLAGAVALAAGGAQTCALLSDGRVECWGGEAAEAPGPNAGEVERDPSVTGPEARYDALFR